MKMRRLFTLLVSLIVVAPIVAQPSPPAAPSAAAPAAAAFDDPAQPPIPAGGIQLLATDPVRAFTTTAAAGNQDAFAFTPVDVSGQPFTQAWRIATNRDLSPAWAVEVRASSTRAVEAGDTGLLRFFVRAVAASDETGSGQLRVVVQKAGPDHQKSLQQTVTMRDQWQEFHLPFTFSDSFAAGGVEVAFGVGFKRETIEVGGVELLHFGKRVPVSALPRTRFTYPGREADAAWRRDALARIEQIRKSAFLIEVRDAAGQPVPGAQVRVEQRSSAFQWGSALQLARLVQDSPDNAIYRAKVLEFFNAASPENDLKWPVWEGQAKGPYNRQQSLQALRWLRENKLHVRGHVLVWPGWKNLPESIRKLRGDPQEEAKIPGRVLAHIADITGATREFIQEWDVLNEPYDNFDLMRLFGEDIMVDWFKAAAVGAPGVPLYLNDYSNHDLVADHAHSAEFVRVAKLFQTKGAPLGGLGLQGHFSAQPNPPENVLAALDAYAKFKLPIRFTELDIDTNDEQLQADFTRDFLILAYSHPSVVGVQHWGFWERAHWRPRAAMFRADWSEKPNAKAYRDLVLKQWRTDLTGVTDTTGRYAARAFHGEVLVTVEHGGRRSERLMTISPASGRAELTLTLP